jgi:hypothetical protein
LVTTRGHGDDVKTVVGLIYGRTQLFFARSVVDLNSPFCERREIR